MSVAGHALVARNLTRETVVATRLEVAGGLWAKFKGLMGRERLGDGAGLWLPDSNGIHMMFMRFPIDAVFVGRPEAAIVSGGGGAAGGSGDGVSRGDGDASGGGAPWREVRPVLSVHRALPPWRGLVPLVRGAHGVLELEVGTIDAAGILVGDRIELSIGSRVA